MALRDQVRLAILAERDKDIEVITGTVLAVNGKEADLFGDQAPQLIRHCQGGLFVEPSTGQGFRLIHHFDRSGGNDLLLVCPACLWQGWHRCCDPAPCETGLRVGSRIKILYRAQPGIVPGPYDAVVVRAYGRMARVAVRGDEPESLYVRHEQDGCWQDLCYGVPCTIEPIGI